MSSEPSRPSTNDKEAWTAFWASQDLPWRTEPEIEAKRQAFLKKRRAVLPDDEKCIFPFKGIALVRADIEWLLMTHEYCGIVGPVDSDDAGQEKRPGLDLRGAVLDGQDLSGLPLAHTLGGIVTPLWQFDGYIIALIPGEGQSLDAALQILDGAAIHLSDANLQSANLIGAYLPGAYLERANLGYARLQRTNLVAAHMEQSRLAGAHLEHAWLADAHMEGATVYVADASLADSEPVHLESAWMMRAHFQKAQLPHAHMQGATLTDANLDGAGLQHVHGEGAWATGVKATKAAFNNSHWEGATLGGAVLTGATFIEAHLERTALVEAHLENARFDDAHMAGTWLDNAHLEGANFKGAHCDGKRLSQEDVDRISKWQPAIHESLPSASFAGAFFDAATTLKGTTLWNKEQGGVYLADVRWGDVNLSLVNWSEFERVGEECAAERKLDESGHLKNNPVRLSERKTAVRVNRQLATALRTQGINEQADYFAYRAHKIQRKVLWRRGSYSRFLWSWVLELLAGYGYQPGRTLGLYVGMIMGFAWFYFQRAGQYHLSRSFVAALVMSVASFHGRGFFPTPNLSLDNPLVVAGAIEAVFGLVIEASFIATFTQRYFGK